MEKKLTSFAQWDLLLQPHFNWVLSPRIGFVPPGSPTPARVQESIQLRAWNSSSAGGGGMLVLPLDIYRTRNPNLATEWSQEFPASAATFTQCNSTVWEQNQGDSTGASSEQCQDTKELLCPLQAAAAQSCSSCTSVPWLGVVPWVLTGAEPAQGSGTASFPQHLPQRAPAFTPGATSEQSTPAPPQASAQTCTRLFTCFFSVWVFCLFAWFLFVCLLFGSFFPQRRDSRHCSALGDEKQPVVAPYSK